MSHAETQNVWDLLHARGFHCQNTHEELLRAQSAQKPLSAYIGFDPTADSFHIGHLVPLMALIHLQRGGQRPIALIGGGTARIGDPSGRNTMRRMLQEEELQRNAQGLQKQLRQLLDCAPSAAQAQETGPAILANNAEWLTPLGLLEFMREVGPHFSVNRMLTQETFRTRLEGGSLSFLEFLYPLLQAYDFLILQRRYDCLLQFGGDDQWTNILSGVELVRRLDRRQVFAWTFPLHTTASGAKMGKTAQGAVWLDPERSSPYVYYQYWINTHDADVGRFLRLFTLLPLEELHALERLEGAALRKAKSVLAYAATELVHGQSEARRAERGAQALFGGTTWGTRRAEEGPAGRGNPEGESPAAIPGAQIEAAQLAAAGWLLTEALSALGLCTSRSEARRLIHQGGVSVNEERVPAEDFRLTTAHLVEGRIYLRLGKKRHYLLELRSTGEGAVSSEAPSPAASSSAGASGAGASGARGGSSASASSTVPGFSSDEK